MGTNQETTKVNAFDVLNEMARRNMRTLKGFGSQNIVSAQAGKNGGGYIRMIVDAETVAALMTNAPLKIMLLVADGNDFDRVKAELEKAAGQE
jgi:hypothetical protein